MEIHIGDRVADVSLVSKEGNLVQLTIDGRNVCVGADTSNHAHFLCTRCGRVFDIMLHNRAADAAPEMPEGFTVEQTAIYFRGCCQECACQQHEHKADC